MNTTANAPTVTANPVILAFLPTPAMRQRWPHLAKSWLTEACHYCGWHHVHGEGEGLRSPHCPVATPIMYEVRYAGVAAKGLEDQYAGSMKRSRRW